MLIEKILNKLPIIKKLPRRVAKPIFVMTIFFDELFWKLRIIIFILVLGKKNKIGKALSDLKKTGVAVIPKFYQDNEVLDNIYTSILSLTIFISVNISFLPASNLNTP